MSVTLTSNNWKKAGVLIAISSLTISLAVFGAVCGFQESDSVTEFELQEIWTANLPNLSATFISADGHFCAALCRLRRDRLTGEQTYQLHVFDTTTGQCVRIHTNPIRAIGFGPSHADLFLLEQNKNEIIHIPDCIKGPVERISVASACTISERCPELFVVNSNCILATNEANQVIWIHGHGAALEIATVYDFADSGPLIGINTPVPHVKVMFADEHSAIVTAAERAWIVTFDTIQNEWVFAEKGIDSSRFCQLSSQHHGVYTRTSDKILLLSPNKTVTVVGVLPGMHRGVYLEGFSLIVGAHVSAVGEDAFLELRSPMKDTILLRRQWGTSEIRCLVAAWEGDAFATGNVDGTLSYWLIRKVGLSTGKTKAE